MKIFANQGDIHSFDGTPLITYVATCWDCARRRWEFTTPEHRDAWARTHPASFVKHHQVTISMEVTASS